MEMGGVGVKTSVQFAFMLSEEGKADAGNNAAAALLYDFGKSCGAAGSERAAGGGLERIRPPSSCLQKQLDDAWLWGTSRSGVGSKADGSIFTINWK